MKDAQHLDKLRISGFRGLSDLDLDGLGAFNVLLGANDVGKTTILEAIFLLSGFANLELPVRVQNLRNTPVHEFDDLSALFHKLEVDRQATLVALCGDSSERTLKISAPCEKATSKTETQRLDSANGDAVKFQSDERAGIQSSSSVPSGPRFLQYKAKVKPASREAPIPFSGKLVIREGNIELTRATDTVSNEIIPVRFLASGVEYPISDIADVSINKKTAELIKYLQVINPHVEEIAVIGTAAFLDIGLEKMIPLNMFGSGMVRTAKILSLCIMGNVRIVLIDELENGLHYQAIPPLMAALLRFSSERRVQVFATTHRLEVLRALQQVLSEAQFSDNQQTTNCYTLQRDKEGLVRSYRYGYDEFEHCMVHGIEIR